MKTKIINNRTPMNNTKTESRTEMNKKIQILTEKLANHFKLRLSSLIIEKNYKYSNMILDIGSFVRKLENSTYETETVIPKLEKYLLEILAKLPSQNSQHFTSMNKINQMMKLEHNDIDIKNNYNHAYNEHVMNNPISPRNLNIKYNIGKDLQNVVSGSDNILNQNESNKNIISEYNLDILSKESPNKKNDSKLPNSSIIASKSEIIKNRNISKTNSKETIINLNNNKANNNIHRNLKKNQSTNKNNDKSNNLLTDPIKDKIAILNTNISNNTYLTSNNFINTADEENYMQNNLGKSNSTNMNTLNSNNHYNYSNKNKNNLNIIQKTEKLNDLKEKALDEWAMIVKYNHLKHLEEEQNKRNKEEEKKKKVREILDNQMKEKDQMKKMKQEEDKKFFQMQTVTIEHMEKDYVEKERLRLEKIKFQKESQEKLIKESQDLKNELRIKDKIRDKIILDKIKNDLVNEEEKFHTKKLNEREMYLKNIKENEEKAELKKRAKEIEKLENKKALDEYTNLIEKQERERIANRQNKIVKSNNDFDMQNQKAKKKEEMQKQFEEQKFLKEKEELEIRMKLQEDSAKYKKLRQIDEVKNALKTQIDEKKKIDMIHKLEDDKFNEMIKSNIKKYVTEKENQLKTYQTKVLGYKESLDNQLQEKGIKKYHMDEKEKLLNKELIGKIYSEFIE